MKELIRRNDCGLFVDGKDNIRVYSREVAEIFNKEHKNVIRDIDKIVKSEGLSEEFTRLNFEPSAYKSKDGRMLREYALTRDGFVMLVMGYTGDNAMHFKEWYITQFNKMQKQLEDLNFAKLDCPLLTDAIKRNNENPKFYHYTNEFDMINKLVLGVSTTKFRKLHNIPKGDSIRPYVTDEQLSLIRKLQNYDIALVDVLKDMDLRKQALKNYLNTLVKQNVLI